MGTQRVLELTMKLKLVEADLYGGVNVKVRPTIGASVGRMPDEYWMTQYATIDAQK